MLANHHDRPTTFSHVRPGAMFWHCPIGPGCGSGNYYTKDEFPTLLFNARKSMSYNDAWFDGDVEVVELVPNEKIADSSCNRS